jgi:hypothetical protein
VNANGEALFQLILWQYFACWYLSDRGKPRLNMMVRSGRSILANIRSHRGLNPPVMALIYRIPTDIGQKTMILSGNVSDRPVRRPVSGFSCFAIKASV